MRKLTTIMASGLLALYCASAMSATMSALTSMDTQTARAVNTPYPITLTSKALASFKVEGTKITVLRSGEFYVNAAAQIGGSGPGEVYLWMRLNDKDVPDSNSTQTVSAAKFTAVMVSQTGMSFKKGDVLEFVYAATSPGLGLMASKPANMPGVPSIIVSILEM